MTDDATAATTEALQATQQLAAADTPQLQAMSALRVGLAGAQLKRLAQSGSFAVDDTTGNRLIESLEGVLESLESRWSALQRLNDKPALSRTAVGMWVSGHMVNTAADEHGLVTQLQAARQEFPTYIEAIKLAKQNYQSREEETRATIVALPSADQS
ncbi:hypothetical protein VA596_36580 [Amycolatopsis sp., V23-08]|uniref:PE domain-containing protein n=1 Tax=Amycolatopsis heterodermiae TaxID=3110235 RepID=A0ABU5RFP6_9PSEU|nr:hypothetical protein [Amycolatopsis sp., V23-08]MEA5365098.1 hypothetical protein [Amycolatopsis sp., V23-08]